MLRRLGAALSVIGLAIAACGGDSPSRSQPPTQPAALGPARLIQASSDLGRLAAGEEVTLTLLLRDRSKAREAADLAALYDPTSPTFGQFKTAGQFASAYGPDPAEAEQAAQQLKALGLTADWQPGEGWLLARGPAARIEAAFQVQLHGYRAPDGTRFYAARNQPQLPAGLRSLLQAAPTVSSYAPWRRHAVPAGGLTPADLVTAYDIKPLRDLGLDGTGETVVFMEADCWKQADLDAFSQKFNLPPMTIELRAGVPPPPGCRPYGEAEMDYEVVHAIAPGARLVAYNWDGSSLDGWIRLHDRMVTENAGAVISESMGACELFWGADRAEAFRQIFDKADQLGEAAFASSGDSGAYGCLGFIGKRSATPSPEYIGAIIPASLPGVTGVGGTRLSVREDGSWLDETVWEWPASTNGTGGAVSAYFPMPAWQKGPGVRNQFSTGYRQMPDISADADPVSGAAINVGGRWEQGGGTSQSAPIWAAMTVLLNQYLKQRGLKPVGFMNPALYDLAAGKPAFPPFHDVTVGGNLVFPATPGYDLPTGLGTPDAWNLARDLEAYQRGAR